MQTVGQVLKESREAKFYSLEEIEKAIKIRKELLLALEADDYTKLPPPTFVQGFIKNYAKFLGLDCQKLLAIFRREFSEKRHKPYVMDTFASPLDINKFKLTPARLLAGVVAALILSFFFYLWMQYRQFVGAPPLDLTSPPDQFTTDNAVIMVQGKTDAEAKVSINDQEIPVSAEGAFQEEINLTSQINKLMVSAISKFGQKTQIERTVYLKR